MYCVDVNLNKKVIELVHSTILQLQHLNDAYSREQS